MKLLHKEKCISRGLEVMDDSQLDFNSLEFCWQYRF